MCPEDSSPALAAALVDQLCAYVSDVVISPGSRNSPLVLALLARRDLRVHVRLDERAAAFTAVGMARASKRHVAVVMTSGTAVANCLPAMIEAHHSGVPLLIVSADRPARLVGTGASQTIEQQGIFGYATAGVTHQVERRDDLADLPEWMTAPQVHINVALDVPLVPDELPARVGERRSRPRPFQPSAPDTAVVELDLRKNTLVIAGDEAWAVEGLEDVPTIAEPTAPAPFRPVHPLAAGFFGRTLRDREGRELPIALEQVVVVGHPTLHREVMGLLENRDCEVVLLSRTGRFTDPALRADARRGSRVSILEGTHPDSAWLRICEVLSDAAGKAVADVLEKRPEPITGLHVAAAVSDTLAVGDTFFVGASNPIRDCSLVGLPFDGVTTISPRGAAGIDGTMSQAIGVALATQALGAEEPRAPRTVALVGDVSFLHDAGGLLIPADSPRPENLTIVVANDDGCGIFELLEIGRPELSADFERGFGTPHGADLGQLCAGYGVEHTQVSTLPELIDALMDDHEAGARGGMHVIEITTTRGDTRRKLAAELRSSCGLT